MAFISPRISSKWEKFPQYNGIHPGVTGMWENRRFRRLRSIPSTWKKPLHSSNIRLLSYYITVAILLSGAKMSQNSTSIIVSVSLQLFAHADVLVILGPVSAYLSIACMFICLILQKRRKTSPNSVNSGPQMEKNRTTVWTHPIPTQIPKFFRCLNLVCSTAIPPENLTVIREWPRLANASEMGLCLTILLWMVRFGPVSIYPTPVAIRLGFAVHSSYISNAQYRLAYKLIPSKSMLSRKILFRKQSCNTKIGNFHLNCPNTQRNISHINSNRRQKTMFANSALCIASYALCRHAIKRTK